MLNKMDYFDFTEYFPDFYTIIGTVIIIIFIRYLITSYQLPPGPWGLPILGYLPFLGKYPELKLAGLSKRYGNVMSLSLGSQLAIVLGDYEAIKEAFLKQANVFSGRPKHIPFKINDDDKGIAINDGDHWQQHRRFALSVFREFGMGKLSMELKIQEEINCFLNELAKFQGQAMDPRHFLRISISNVIAALEFGHRYEYSDVKFHRLLSILEKNEKLLGSVIIRAFFPFIRRLPFFEKITGHAKTVNFNKELRIFLRDTIKEHEIKYADGSQKDYIDAYLTNRKQLIEQNGKVGCFDDNWLEGNLLNLFGAGSETTATTIRWTMLYLMAFPEIQKKVQHEIDEVIGMNRFPSMSDRCQMPYTEATLNEVHRCSSIVALNVVHSNLEETYLFGYRIPKRSYVISNLWAVHHDPELWEKPEVFMPERFLDNNGQLKKIEYLIPFSIGKRSCIGESLARMELFLHVTAMLQRFTLLPPNDSSISFAYEVGVVRSPVPFSVRAIARENYDVNW